MSYESRIFVAEKITLPHTEKTEYTISTTLADMRLSRMPNSFPEIFTNEIAWEIYGDNETDLTKDKYGDTCHYADIQTVIDYLESIEPQDYYRRIPPALAMLKAYAAPQWGKELIVIHYGY